jgi:thiamine biosynthesis lipoprotein
VTARGESSETFACFGSRCSVFVTGDGDGGTHAEAVAMLRTALLAWHRQFTRFEPGSELSLLNASPDATLAVSPMMRRFAGAVIRGAELSGGLVDGTLLQEIQDAGYRTDLGEPLELSAALRLAPARRPASMAPGARWREISVDDDAGTISRPPGILLDSGGLAKGLFADVLAERIASHRSFAIDCGGDVRLGGTAGLLREVRVESPFEDQGLLHVFELPAGGIATSGIGRRSWLDASGTPAHHLLDPSTGRPAYTGVVQATALAPSAFEAEVRAKCAVLGGPEAVDAWLGYGGVVVFDDGSCRVLP